MTSLIPGHRLGGFTVRRPLGAGGMGSVWQATTDSGVEVAIKVLSAAHLARRGAREAFDLEIRRAARLDHPAIARILDLGTDPDAGPWFAMTLADGGTLAEVSGWPELSRLLGDVLDGLAHAHAHGLVHRDIKPENLLSRGRGDARHALVTDFGASWHHDEGERPEQTGSALYMAPEQIRGSWRLEGPWTDLYALGCTVWEIVTGAPVFHGRDPREVHRAHLLEDPPTFRPRFAVPDGLETWLHRCLDKSPQSRFRDASEASRALGVPRGAVRRAAPVLPASALRMVGLRRGRFVGRERARDALLRAWEDARSEPTLAVLHGPRGVGRSALATWLSRTLVARGEAVAFLATHGEAAGPSDGVRGLLARALRVLPSQSLDQAHAHVADLVLRGAGRLDLSEAADLARVLLGRPVRGDAQRRAVLARRAIQRQRGARGAVVVLDDVDRSDESVQFARYLLEADPFPLLVVAVVEDPPAELAGLGATTVDLSPMVGTEAEALVDSWLPLLPEARETVLRRASGRPEALLQLVLAWRDHGVLGAHADGVGLDAPPREVAADSLWADRLTALVAVLSPQEVTALTPAGVLGMRFSVGSWEALAAAVGGSASASLRRQLLDRGLVRTLDAERWQFVHPAFVDAVVAADPDVARVHLAAAAQYVGDDPLSVARRARHEALAGRTDGAVALEPVLSRFGARADVSLGDQVARIALEVAQLAGDRPLEGAALRVLGWSRARARSFDDGRQLCERALTLADAGRTAALARVQLADIARFQGDYDAATAHLDAAVALDARAEGPSLAVRSGVAMAQGDLDGLRRAGARALELAHDTRARIAATLELCEGLVYLRKNREVATVLAGLARERSLASADRERLWSYLEAQVALSEDDHVTARAAFERARRLADEDGHLGFVLGCTSRLAALDRIEGDLDAAEGRQRALYARHRRRGNLHGAAVAAANLALIALDRGDASGADEALDLALPGAQPGAMLRSVVDIVRARVRAELGDEVGMREAIAAAGHRDVLDADDEMASQLEHVRRICQERGWTIDAPLQPRR